MARYVDTIDLPLPLEEAFDYLADFSTTAEWDPGVVAARRLTRGPVSLGSRFRVEVRFAGRPLALVYEISEYERPHRLVLRAEDDGLRSVDEITFVAKGEGTRVTYEARVELLGLRALADPLLHLLFQQVGRTAVRGLRERVDARVSDQTKKRRTRKRAKVARTAGRAGKEKENDHGSSKRRRAS